MPLGALLEHVWPPLGAQVGKKAHQWGTFCDTCTPLWFYIGFAMFFVFHLPAASLLLGTSFGRFWALCWRPWASLGRL